MKEGERSGRGDLVIYFKFGVSKKVRGESVGQERAFYHWGKVGES